MDSKRILIVDDDDLVATSFQGIMESEGFEIDTSLNGEDAIKQVRETSYDLVIL